MLKKFRPAWFWLSAITLVVSGSAAHDPAAAAHGPQGERGAKTGEANEVKKPLPYARGNTFKSLDEYLLYLERYNGPIDMPYWHAVGPGRYELVTTMRPLGGDAHREIATREELLERFGFER